MSNSPHWSVNHPQESGYYFFQLQKWDSPVVLKLFKAEAFLDIPPVMYCDGGGTGNFPISNLNGFWWSEPIDPPVKLILTPPQGAKREPMRTEDLRLCYVHWLISPREIIAYGETCEACRNAIVARVIEMSVGWESPIPNSTNMLCETMAYCDGCESVSRDTWTKAGSMVSELEMLVETNPRTERI